jgi:hypothetical protein
MLQRILSPFREFGPWAGALYAIDRMLQTLSTRTRLQYYELVVQPVPATPLVPERFTRRLEFREIKRGDPALDLMPALPEIRAARFDQGAFCLGAFQKGKLIGYVWFCERAYDEDEVRCTYELVSPRNCVFDFDLYILPEYRMGMAFASLWTGANELLRRRGVDFTFSRMTRFNLASRRAHKHLGSVRIGRAVFLQAWRLQLMIATQSPYVHCSASSLQRARLRVAPATPARNQAGTGATDKPTLHV